MTSGAPLLVRAYGPVVSGRTWRATGKVFLDLPLVWVSSITVLVPAAIAIPTAIVFPVSIGFATASLLANRLFSRFDRYRLDVFLDLPLANPHAPRPPGPRATPAALWRLFVAQFRDGATWRSYAYRLVEVPVAALCGLALVLAWCVPLTALTAPGWVWLLPDDRIDLWRLHLGGAAGGSVGFLLGVALLPVAPVLVGATAGVQRWLGRVLLGPRGDQQLAERVVEVETSRARVVDAAEVERKRIERDLHDGAQQRLVALAMNLGMAKERFDTDPAGARALVDDAHAEAKRALVELRDLARGLHPAVLTDRGLGPALSAVAARSNVPVTVDVDLARRPDPTTEGIAYFVVCEALANVAKHSGAAHATVSITRAGDRLVLEVRDDGRGGASFEGSGLAGLRDRVQAVDGWLQVISPDGGPTTILAELPCAS